MQPGSCQTAGSGFIAGEKGASSRLTPGPVSNVRVGTGVTREVFSMESLPEVLNNHE